MRIPIEQRASATRPRPMDLRTSRAEGLVARQRRIACFVGCAVRTPALLVRTAHPTQAPHFCGDEVLD